MSKIVEAKGIQKSFEDAGEKRNVINGVDFSVEEGEFVAVMGPSGSGKTTLLFCVSGMDTADEGSILFQNQDLASCSEKELAGIRRQQMGFIFQQPSLLKNLNLLDNIVLTSIKENKKKAKEMISRAENLMEKTGIGNLKNRNIKKVSGGELQRAGICRALMNNPQILFGDEPTGALNSKAAEEIMNIFEKVNEEGTAVMLVTHDTKVAAGADRVVFMKDGELVSELKLGKRANNNMDERIHKVREEMKEIGI